MMEILSSHKLLNTLNNNFSDNSLKKEVKVTIMLTHRRFDKSYKIVIICQRCKECYSSTVPTSVGRECLLYFTLSVQMSSSSSSFHLYHDRNKVASSNISPTPPAVVIKEGFVRRKREDRPGYEDRCYLHLHGSVLSFSTPHRAANVIFYPLNKLNIFDVFMWSSFIGSKDLPTAEHLQGESHI